MKENTEETAVTVPASEPETATQENAEVSSSPKEDLIEIINKFNPGSPTSTDAEVIESALGVLNMMTPIYDKMYDLALASPETASFLNDLLETGDVPKSLARNFDPEELQALMEGVTDDGYEDDRVAHSSKIAEAKSIKETVSKNMEVSLNEVAAFMEQRKHWEPTKAEEFQEKVLQHYQDGVDGKITKADLEMLEKAFNYDNDLTEAEENGRIMGKNEQIVAKKLSKEDQKAILPELNSGMTPAPKSEEKPKPFASKFMEGVL